MAEIINLNKYRKARERKARAEQAAANRTKTGRSKAERQADTQRIEKAEQTHDQHRLDEDE